MITIFNGRKVSLDGTEDEIYITIGVTLRDRLHHFNAGKNLNSFAVFMKIAMHIDKHGWSFPGRENIKESTGLSSDKAITSALKHLCKMRIEGHRVMEMYRSRDPENKVWGPSLYRVFPDGFNDGLANVPGRFCSLELRRVEADPLVDDLVVDNLVTGDPVIDNAGNKDNHPIEENPPIEEKALPDPLAVLAEKGWGQQGDSWTVPAAAGGADDWQPCVDAFAGLVGVNPDILPRSDRKEWSRVLSEIGVKWGVGPPTVQKAIESVPESQFDWKTYATPHQAEADLSTLVGQIRSGGVKKPKQKGAADDFEAIMAAFAGTEGTMIIDGDCVVL